MAFADLVDGRLRSTLKQVNFPTRLLRGRKDSFPSSPFQFSTVKKIMKPRQTPAHLDLAISAAASLVVGSMNRAADDPKATARILAQAILPAFGIAWNRDTIQSLSRDVANQLLLKLRNSPLPRLHYDRLADLFKTAFSHP